MDINSLDRFLEAQERMYEIALKEIRNGEKESHWMWYIFPQLRGLGRSQMAYTYGINVGRSCKCVYAHARKRVLCPHKKNHPFYGWILVAFKEQVIYGNDKYGPGECNIDIFYKI